MRKTLLSSLLLFVAAATLSNCSKDETTDPATTAQTTISATLEESTRTMLDGTAVKWVAGDKIMVANAGTTTAEYTLTTGKGTTSGTFTGKNLGAGAKFALYPYSATATCNQGKFSFEMPATQDNGNVTFGNGANPMIAQRDAKGVLNFKNVCGAIRLQLKGTQKVSKIVVSTAITAEKLSGKATVAFVNTLPVLTLDKAAANTVTLNCNNAQLTADAATSFYVVVPAATYTTGLQFMIYDETGTHIYSLPTTQALTINRSKVAKMPEKTVAKMNFPDPKFRAALVSSYELILTTDGDIDVNDAGNKAKFTSRTYIDVSYKQIASLQGIEYFTGLTQLSCHFNQLTSLDLSKNTALTRFECYNNQLQSLDLSKNTALTFLDCSPNQLTSLDVSKNTALTELRCGNNKLKSLDVSKNTKLTKLYCNDNHLPNLDVSTCSMLTNLGCGNQHADGGTEGAYTPLELTCTESQKALISLTTETQYNNNVAFKRMIAFPDAKFRAALVRKYGLILTTDETDIDVNNGDNKAKFTSLLDINVYNGRISSLKGIEYFTALTLLDCGSNQLTSLDVSQNTKLMELICHINQLTSLDVSKNTALTNLQCYFNKLTSLNVSKNTALTSLSCSMNQLKSLDVSQNTALSGLSCDQNQLTSLDLSENTALTQLYCHRNKMSTLNTNTCPKLNRLTCGNQYADGVTGETSIKMNLACPESQKALLYLPEEKEWNKEIIFERISAFPDANFRAWLQTNLGCQLTTDGTDIDMTVQKNKDVFATTTKIDVSNKNIVSMDGIEYFTALTQLSCLRNQLINLDIRPLTSLSTVLCGQQLAGGAVAPSYSELNLFMTQTQFNTDLGKNFTGWVNDNVTRIVAP